MIYITAKIDDSYDVIYPKEEINERITIGDVKHQLAWQLKKKYAPDTPLDTFKKKIIWGEEER